LAQMLSIADPPLRRSVAFVTFSAEEQGLLGSRIFVEEQISLQPVVLMINLDMIGRNARDPVQIMGNGYTPGLREIVETANRVIGLSLRFGGMQYSPASDHDPFFQEGIPFLFFFTGIHPDYHGREDHSEKLAYPRMKSIMNLVQAIVLEVARNDDAIGSSISVWWLGLTVQLQEQEGGWTAAITGVQEGSQAQRKGFRKGDRITDLDGVPFGGPRDLRKRMCSLEPEQELAVRLLRDGRELVVSFRRAPAGYLGVMIERPEEDLLKQNELQAFEGVMVSRVLPDGPAQRAGLRKGDVILAIANRPVSVANLSGILAQIGAYNPVELTLLRQEERITVNLTLGVQP
jgi:type II secretory pathway component PulC